MKKIKLTKGKYAIVDDEDYEKLSKYNWYCMYDKYNFYAIRSEKKTLLMHRIILNYFDKLEIDHINGNTLDNRKENLRLCTHKNNSYNRGRQRNNTSGYKGVCFKKGRYCAQIQKDNKVIHLGNFKIKEEAVIAYNEGAKKYFGEFGFLNKL